MTNPTPLPDEREAFERHYLQADYVMIMCEGVYVDRFVQHMWHAWQARATQPPAALPVSDEQVKTLVSIISGPISDRLDCAPHRIEEPCLKAVHAILSRYHITPINGGQRE